jgi:hypothetical protein
MTFTNDFTTRAINGLLRRGAVAGLCARYDLDPGTSVPLGANQRKRAKEFYYLLFLDSVPDCCQYAIARKVAFVPQNPNQSSEADFRTLVNKLAHICDSRPGGDTVMALVVLLVDGKPVYAFASNSMKRSNLIQTKDDFTSVLNILKVNLKTETKESDQVLFDRLLRQMLRLNPVRVQTNLTHLTKDLAACVKACEGDVSEESSFPLSRAFFLSADIR